MYFQILLLSNITGFAFPQLALAAAFRFEVAAVAHAQSQKETDGLSDSCCTDTDKLQVKKANSKTGEQCQCRQIDLCTVLLRWLDVLYIFLNYYHISSLKVLEESKEELSSQIDNLKSALKRVSEERDLLKKILKENGLLNHYDEAAENLTTRP